MVEKVSIDWKEELEKYNEGKNKNHMSFVNAKNDDECSAFICHNCEQMFQFFMPLSLTMMGVICKQFEKQHKNCK